MQLGAYDFLTKPVELAKILVVVRRALKHQALGTELKDLRRRGQRDAIRWLMGPGQEIQQVIQQIRQVADSNFTILIQGETGTGKELVARSIHQLSARRERPFVALDCGAIPETLIESELFGYEKGAFTGADRRRKGHFQLAEGGTLFLDEIVNLPFPTQAKLLRTLEERQVQVLGAKSAVPVDVRIIAAAVTAKLVVAMASSTSNGSTATSSADGSALIGLTVNGTAIEEAPSPNTTIPIPGVGSVILNEQIFSGDSVQTTALTVNMIHVVLDGTLGTGDIIVSSAHSDVNFVAVSTTSPATGFMTGGGRLGTGQNIATFGFNAGPGGRGQLQYTDHGQRLNVHSTGINSYSSGGVCATFSGTARVNNADGYRFTVRQACDIGEPGAGRDTFEISVEGLYSSTNQFPSSQLTGGNLQLH